MSREPPPALDSEISPAAPDARLHLAEGWLGAITFADEEAAWDTCNPDVRAEAPTLYFDHGHGTEFDHSAAIPLELVREAVTEVALTGKLPPA